MTIIEKIFLKSISTNPSRAIKSGYSAVEVNYYYGWVQVSTYLDVIANRKGFNITKDIRGGFFTFRVNGYGYLGYMDNYANGDISCVLSSPIDLEYVFNAFAKPGNNVYRSNYAELYIRDQNSRIWHN